MGFYNKVSSYFPSFLCAGGGYPQMNTLSENLDWGWTSRGNMEEDEDPFGLPGIFSYYKK